MKNQIIIREAISEADTAAFWEQLHSYHKRDIFPDPEDENLKHFLSDTEYRVQIEHVHNRLQDRCYYLFFERNGQDIGFALPAIFTSEDGKCFILEFCIFPEFRGGGTGRARAGLTACRGGSAGIFAGAASLLVGMYGISAVVVDGYLGALWPAFDIVNGFNAPNICPGLIMRTPSLCFCLSAQ